MFMQTQYAASVTFLEKDDCFDRVVPYAGIYMLFVYICLLINVIAWPIYYIMLGLG